MPGEGHPAYRRSTAAAVGRVPSPGDLSDFRAACEISTLITAVSGAENEKDRLGNALSGHRPPLHFASNTSITLSRAMASSWDVGLRAAPSTAFTSGVRRSNPSMGRNLGMHDVRTRKRRVAIREIGAWSELPVESAGRFSRVPISCWLLFQSEQILADEPQY